MPYVLIVDDDEDFASAVAAVLRGEGHEVAMEHSPELGLARVERRRPDVIVLDVMFPESPSAGFELARTIQRRFAGIPILMLTAVNQQFPLGFSSRDIDPKWLPITEFIEKPVDFGALCDQVKRLTSASDT
jgi:two-component system alkaline phosphatase synthesis response regulator PhoP